MAVFNGMFPILSGKEEAARDFARQVAGPRNGDFAAFQKGSSTTRETWTVQGTPAGSFMLVWFEGDVEKAFEDLATTKDEFSDWFRAQILNVTGVDMTQPDDSPPPETVLDWRA